MNKKSPFFTASVASIIYFVIYLALRYFLPSGQESGNVEIDWPGALLGAVVFWLVIFIVHQFLKRRYSD